MINISNHVLKAKSGLRRVPMYLVGEALVGDGAELAHIDLLMGDKEGPIGTAFANAI